MRGGLSASMRRRQYRYLGPGRKGLLMHRYQELEAVLDEMRRNIPTFVRYGRKLGSDDDMLCVCTRTSVRSSKVASTTATSFCAMAAHSLKIRMVTTKLLRISHATFADL